MNRIAASTVLVVLGVAFPAWSAPIFVEVGDAGPLRSTAQNVALSGADTILGNLQDPGGDPFADVLDVDMYKVFISDPLTFSASTLDSPLNVSDPQLFLFDKFGRGVYMDDDDESGFSGAQSALPAGHPLGPTTPGIYFLAIGWFNNEPLDALAALIFDTSSPVGVNGPASLNPVVAWNDDVLGRLDLPTAYEITLTGTSVPEPGTVLLLATALGLGVRRRRRKSRPSPERHVVDFH